MSEDEEESDAEDVGDVDGVPVPVSVPDGVPVEVAVGVGVVLGVALIVAHVDRVAFVVPCALIDARTDSDVVYETCAVADEFAETKGVAVVTAKSVGEIVVVTLTLTECEPLPVAAATAELVARADDFPVFEEIVEGDTDFTPDGESSAVLVARTDAVGGPDADSETLGDLEPNADFDDETETFDDELIDGLGDDFRLVEATLDDEANADTVFANVSTAVSVTRAEDDARAVLTEVPVTVDDATVESVARGDADAALDAEFEPVAIETVGEVDSAIDPV